MEHCCWTAVKKTRIMIKIESKINQLLYPVPYNGVMLCYPNINEGGQFYNFPS